MQRVKLFKGLECELDRLEQQINDWAESEGAKILQINSSIASQSYNPRPKAGHHCRATSASPPMC